MAHLDKPSGVLIPSPTLHFLEILLAGRPLLLPPRLGGELGLGACLLLPDPKLPLEDPLHGGRLLLNLFKLTDSIISAAQEAIFGLGLGGILGGFFG
jgi:hypothetical protein